MSRKDKLVKSKSLYTLRSKHTSLLDGTIYENDHVTIVRNDGLFDEDVPLYSESNFKFRIGLGNGERKRHSRGGWVEVDGAETNIWTLDNLPIKQTTDDGKIVLKPNYTSLKDFAYYGSAVELIKATINDVIRRYPGGISYYKSAPTIKTYGDHGLETFCLVSNEFNIDFWTPIGASTDGLENPMRVIGASYMNYEDKNGNDIGLQVCITGNCPNTIIGKVKFTNGGGSIHHQQTETRSIVFGAGSDSDENQGFDNDSDSNEGRIIERGESPGINFKTIKVICYSGVNETNYLQDVTMANIPIRLYCEDLNLAGLYTPLESGDPVYTSRNGSFVFNRSDIPLTTISSIQAFAWYEGNEFSSAKIKSQIPENYVLNIYINSNNVIPVTNNFPFVIQVTDCETGENVAGAQVYIYAYLMLQNAPSWLTNANKPFRYGPIITNTRGIASLYGNETTWEYNGEQIEVSNYYISSWRAGASYNGGPEVAGGSFVNGEINSYSLCVNIEHETIPFTIITAQGICGPDNIGPGNASYITFFDENNNTLIVTGQTDENGTYSITWDSYSSNPNYVGFVPTHFFVSMTNENESIVSRTIYFSNTPTSYSVPLYFTYNPTPEEKILSVTAYSESNGILKPAKNISVTFSAVTEKNAAKYTLTRNTDDNGVVTAILPNDSWVCTNGFGETELIDVKYWSVYTFDFTTNENVFGVGSPNNLKNNDTTDTITIQEQSKWDNICVYTIDQNNQSIDGVNVTVCASTTSSVNEYYAIGVSNNGVVCFTQSSRWRRFSGPMLAGSINDFTRWSCEGVYNEIKESAYGLGISVEGVTLRFQVPEEPIVPPNPYVNNCTQISVPGGFYVFLDEEGNKLLLTTQSDQNSHAGEQIIRPKSAYTEEFWSTLDDFEKVLLNRTTKEKYKAKLESPFIIENKHYYEFKNYIWPTVDTAGTPDMTSGVFQGYLQSLMNIAEYYDEYDSDNLWRMMTHESIKNLDWSFSRNIGDDNIENEDIDYARMQAILRTEARVFDDIKRYADNIKTMNTISYDEKNNAPDYFLSDIIELNGFEAKNISRFSGCVSDVIYSSTTISGRTDSEVNSDFMRRLVLSEKYLLSEKGTRRGIEGILGMFGYVSGIDYSIREYVAVANQFPLIDEVTYLRTLGDEYINVEGVNDFMEGYPLVQVIPATGEKNYTIPWVDKNEKYLNGLYFQGKGGWGRLDKKKINLSISLATEISGTGEFNLYSETLPYMTYVSDLDELIELPSNRIYANMVCYVVDISKIYTTYSAETDYNTSTTQQQQQNDRGIPTQVIVQNQSYKDFSHYFILKNTMLSSYIGFVSNERYNCYGWKNILLREFETEATTVDGLRVLYLESLSLNENGNNPHCGYGKYDDGLEYINKLDYIFSYALSTGNYDYLKNGDEDDVNDYNKLFTTRFAIQPFCIDNKKCHFFVNDNTEVVNTRGSVQENGTTTTSLNQQNSLKFIDAENASEDVNINDGGYNGVCEDGKEYCFVHPEHLGSCDFSYKEGASNSIVNLKNMTIEFKTHNNDYFKKYLQNIVFSYLNEMIPSSTILRYKFDDTEDEGTQQNTPHIAPMDSVSVNSSASIIVGDTAYIGTDDTYLIEDNTGLFNNTNNNER